MRYTVRVSGYVKRLRMILDASERRLFSSLDSPVKIQNFLDTLPINFETRGETYMSPRTMLRAQRAHCFEGAAFAAAVLAYHNQRPLLLDLKTAKPDTDHVVALFKVNGLWGAISKTNHPVLRYRDPVFRNVRELALSYFNEYFLSESGAKTLREYSIPFNLSRYGTKWITRNDDLIEIVNDLNDAPHTKIAPNRTIKALRKADRIERSASDMSEWSARGVRLW